MKAIARPSLSASGLLLLLALLPVAAEAEEWTTAVQAIQGGEVDDENVGVMGMARVAFPSCSGALIAPNLVLTAQHCVFNTEQRYVNCGQAGFTTRIAPRFIRMTSDTVFQYRGGTNYRGLELHVPPDTDDLCGFDIALLILTENVPQDEVPYLIPRIDGPVQTGESYTAIGYGTTGDNSGSGTRRILRDRVVQCVGGECWRELQVHEREFLGSSGTCPGDSGGPAIDAWGQIIGVVSRGPEGCGDTVYTSVPAFADWMREIGMRAAELGEYEPPPWVALGDASPQLVDADRDGIRDPLDNCPDVANPDQTDTSGNGVGDACDEPPSARGGDCATCDSCWTDDDCEEGACTLTPEGSFCLVSCDEADDCPGDTICPEDGALAGLCVNPDLEAEGLCPEAYVCSLPAPEPEPTPGGEEEARATGSKGCSASASAPGVGAGWWLLGLAALRRRRAR